MTWVRIDDQFPENPKIAGLHDRSFRLHMIGLCYCARNLTDGRLTAKQAKVVHAILGSNAKRWAEELVAAGLWKRDKTGTGFTINHYTEFNPPAEKVKELRRRAAQRQQKHRAKAHGAFDEDVRPEDIGERDGWVCYLCQGEIRPESLVLDHVVPLSRGGRHNAANLRSVHFMCNARKGARTPEELSHLSHLRSQPLSQGVGHDAPSPTPLKEPIPKGFTSYVESPELELVRETIADALGDAA